MSLTSKPQLFFISALNGILIGVLAFIIFVEVFHLLYSRKYSVIYFTSMLIRDIFSVGLNSAVNQRRVKFRLYRETDTEIQQELTNITDLATQFLSDKGIFQDPLSHEGEVGTFLPLKQRAVQDEQKYSDTLSQVEVLTERKRGFSEDIKRIEKKIEKGKREVEESLPTIVQQLDKNRLLLKILTTLKTLHVLPPNLQHEERLLKLSNTIVQVFKFRKKRKLGLVLSEQEERLYSILVNKQSFNFYFGIYRSIALKKERKMDVRDLKRERRILADLLENMNTVFELKNDTRRNNQAKRALQSQKRRVEREISSLKMTLQKIKEEIQDINSRLDHIENDEEYLPSLLHKRQRLIQGVEYLDTRKERVGKDIGEDKVKDCFNRLTSILKQLEKEEMTVQSASL